MKRLYKVANKFFKVLCEEGLAPETLRSPFSYEDIDQEEPTLEPLSDVQSKSDYVSLRLTPKEIEDLNYLMSAILYNKDIMKKLVSLHGKSMFDIANKINHYTSQLRISLKESPEGEVRVASSYGKNSL